MEGLTEWQSATPIPDLAKRRSDPDWERKQRFREYRVAAHREKRTRKADEKKQRKLNATILRRMTRNPTKYTKNVDRNRLRAIESERRTIWNQATKQAQRLAAVHDPSGKLFNIGPVVVQDDGRVVSLEALRRREEKQVPQETGPNPLTEITNEQKSTKFSTNQSDSKDTDLDLLKGMNPERLKLMNLPMNAHTTGMSKRQQKKLEALEPRPPPPKPIIPENIKIPEDEEDWLALWDLSDDQLERRVQRTKNTKAAARKAIRTKQKSGKVERRAARDEKRRVYRELKMTWKNIKEEEKKHNVKLKGAEDEEAKKIAVAIATMERMTALDHCAKLGFTLDNTAGVDDIKPRARGMKGVDVDFEALELGDTLNKVRLKVETIQSIKGKKHVNLSAISKLDGPKTVADSGSDESDRGEYIKLDVGSGQDHEALHYNHKVRRKLRKAIESALMRKELLVREQAINHYKEKQIDIPSILQTPVKPVHERGERALEDGTLETAKKERVRLRVELAEFNKAAKVLRKQAEGIATEAGLRVHAEMTGKIPPRESSGDDFTYGAGWLRVEKPPEDGLYGDDVSDGGC